MALTDRLFDRMSDVQLLIFSGVCMVLGGVLAGVAVVASLHVLALV